MAISGVSTVSIFLFNNPNFTSLKEQTFVYKNTSLYIKTIFSVSSLSQYQFQAVVCLTIFVSNKQSFPGVIYKLRLQQGINTNVGLKVNCQRGKKGVKKGKKSVNLTLFIM